MQSIKVADAMPCKRCGKDARQGVMISLRGPGTGYNTEHYLLCERCVGPLRLWLADEPVDLAAASEERHRLFAERFARKGLAQ